MNETAAIAYAVIRRLIPLHLLPQESCKRLYDTLVIEEAPPGEILFERGDTAREWVYLLEGRVALEAGGIVMDEIDGGSDSARFPLAHQIPRKVTARALTGLRYVRVDPGRIEPRPPQEETRMADRRPETTQTQGDWMTRLLKSPVFQRLPANHLQKILQQLEEKALDAGAPVILQGEVADCVYILRSGRCEVTRQPRPGGRMFKLGDLKPGDLFGEDAILSGQARAVTVRMATDGVVLRLPRERFLELVVEPVLDALSFEAAYQEVAQGSAWLDVRDPDQYHRKHIQGSLNVPFFSLRMQLTGLQRTQRYITVSEDGRLASAAAFLLLKHGFEAAVLEGGLQRVPAKCLQTPDREESGEGDAPAPETPPPADGEQAEQQQRNRWLQEMVATLEAEKAALESRLASREEAQAALEAEVGGLRRRVAELEAAIREYCEAAAEMTADERVAALQAELEMVREQADADVQAMRNQVEALQARCEALAGRGGEGDDRALPADWTPVDPADLPLTVEAPPPPAAVTGARAWAGPLLWMLVGLLAGLAALGLTLQSDAGRHWLVRWSGGVAPAASAPPPARQAPATPAVDDLFSPEEGAVTLDPGGDAAADGDGEAPEDLFAP